MTIGAVVEEISCLDFEIGGTASNTSNGKNINTNMLKVETKKPKIRNNRSYEWNEAPVIVIVHNVSKDGRLRPANINTNNVQNKPISKPWNSPSPQLKDNRRGSIATGAPKLFSKGGTQPEKSRNTGSPNYSNGLSPRVRIWKS